METHVVNTHEAKTQLSALIREAETGVDVIVARHGRPVARIVPWVPDAPQRKPGRWAGQVTYDDADLVGSDPEVVDLFDESTRAST